MHSDKIRIIYIAGYGHSGSTILEMLLSCSKGVVGFGELSEIGKKNPERILNIVQQKKFCKKYYDHINEKLDDIDESMKAINDIVHCEYLSPKKRKMDLIRYKKFWDVFFSAAAEVNGDAQSIFVDSSKSSISRALRPILLNGLKNIDLTCIHLFREPTPILFRLRKKAREKKNIRPQNEFLLLVISSCHWIFSNIWPILISKSCKRYVRLSFEQLCKEPEETLKNLSNEIELDLNEAISRIKNKEPLSHTCALAGNRILFQDEIRFQPQKNSSKSNYQLLEKIFAFILHPIYKFLTYKSV